MSTPEIAIGDFQVFVNPQVPEAERQQFEKAMRDILSDTNALSDDTKDKEDIDQHGRHRFHQQGT